MDRPDETPKQAVDENRREALRQLSRFGAYTAPALVAMLASEKAAAVTDT